MTLWNDIKYGFRILLKNPGFTVVTMLLLSLGIGANTALFSVINSVLLSPLLPFPEPDRVVYVQTYWKHTNSGGMYSGADYMDLRDQSTVFKGLSALDLCSRFCLTGAGDPITVGGCRVGPDFFGNVAEQPLLGRGFDPGECESGNRLVAILSNRLWRDLFGADPNVVGREIIVDGQSHTIIGVAKSELGPFEELSQIFLPIRWDVLKANRGDHYLLVYGRLNKNVSMAQAQSELNVIASRLENKYPESNRNKGIKVYHINEVLVANIRPMILILYGVVGLVFLIACINIASLLLARSGARGREIAIRWSLGAARGRILRQMFTESILLALLGGGLGLVFAQMSLDIFRLIAPRIPATGGSAFPGFDKVGLNVTVLAFTAILSVLTGFLFGLIPAWQSASLGVGKVLKESGHHLSCSRSRHRTLNVLVVSEVALAMLLLIVAGLLIRSFYKLFRTHPGFDTTGVLAVEIHRPDIADYREQSHLLVFYEEVIQRIKNLPVAESVGGISLHSIGSINCLHGFTIEGRTYAPGESSCAEYRSVAEDYFRCMRIPLVHGRFFSSIDDGKGERVIIVNQEFVRQFFPNEDPIGKVIKHDGMAKTIVGVVGNVKQGTLSARDFEPFFYEPVQQFCSDFMTILIRTAGNPEQLISAVRQAVWDVDPDQPILRIRTMRHIVAESVSSERFSTILLCVLALMALFMAGAGLYGMMTYAVSERTREIGMRIAIGAVKSDILKMIGKYGLCLTLIGLGIGLAGAFALTRCLSSLLYDIKTTDTVTFIIVPLLLFVISMLACYIPARRAAKIDPMVALRYE